MTIRSRQIAQRTEGSRSRTWTAAAVVAVAAGLAGGAVLVAAGLGAARPPAAAPLPATALPATALPATALPATQSSGGESAGSPVGHEAQRPHQGGRSGEHAGTGGRGGPSGPSGPSGASGPRAAAAAGRTARVAWQAGLRPGQIKIPVLGVTASIAAAVIDAAGDLVPPRSPDVVGEWNGSAGLDAARGEVTLAGHVNWAGMGPFAFAGLAYLVPGDLIYTTGAGGRQAAWRVTAVFALAKSLPLDGAAFAGTGGPRRLALITCGGGYDAATASYDDNVYVLAAPAGFPGR